MVSNFEQATYAILLFAIDSICIANEMVRQHCIDDLLLQTFVNRKYFIDTNLTVSIPLYLNPMAHT